MADSNMYGEHQFEADGTREVGEQPSLSNMLSLSRIKKVLRLIVWQDSRLATVQGSREIPCFRV
jgi:hypothetical protein